MGYDTRESWGWFAKRTPDHHYVGGTASLLPRPVAARGLGGAVRRPGEERVQCVELVEGKGRVEPARVGKHPHRGIGDRLGLTTEHGARPGEPDPVRGDSEHGEHGRPLAPDLRLEATRPRDQLL